MSNQLKPTLYKEKSLELQWLNNIFSSHDLCCGCNDPVLHLMILINKTGEAPKPEEEIKNIKCLLTGGKPTTVEDIDLSPGDLEELFKEEDDGDHTENPEKHTGEEDCG